MFRNFFKNFLFWVRNWFLFTIFCKVILNLLQFGQQIIYLVIALFYLLMIIVSIFLAVKTPQINDTYDIKLEITRLAQVALISGIIYFSVQFSIGTRDTIYSHFARTFVFNCGSIALMYVQNVSYHYKLAILRTWSWVKAIINELFGWDCLYTSDMRFQNHLLSGNQAKN